ncbi:MAG: hypothetical protein ACTS6G_03150 [Candidatus Hodgkinia cicadicola]
MTRRGIRNVRSFEAPSAGRLPSENPIQTISKPNKHQTNRETEHVTPTRFAILTSFDGFEASERSVLNVRSARNGTWLPSVGRPNDASGSEANE